MYTIKPIIYWIKACNTGLKHFQNSKMSLEDGRCPGHPSAGITIEDTSQTL